jgi:hypothetical protein
VRSAAPYELMSVVLAGETPAASLVAQAFEAPATHWTRALALEGCAVQLDRALRSSTAVRVTPPWLHEELAAATATAITRGLHVSAQLTELSEIAASLGIRMLLLKGAARLLERSIIPGERSISDIDVLAPAADARRLHLELCERYGYRALAAAPEHHLPTLLRTGSLPVEVHVQTGPARSPLDDQIWRDARVQNGVHLPSPTMALLHWLEHGALVHWAVRYRLRDVLDVAAAWSARVDREHVIRYLRQHHQRVALETLLSAAHRFSSDVPTIRPRAWTTVRRVAYTRHFIAATIRPPALAKSLCIAAGVLAEASPRALWRPAHLALFGVRQARADYVTQE